MAKPDQADFKEVPELALQFKKRYNRDVRVFRVVTLADGNIDRAFVRIDHNGKVYELFEKLKDGLTEFATATIAGVERVYKTYLEAEISIADAMGE